MLQLSIYGVLACWRWRKLEGIARRVHYNVNRSEETALTMLIYVFLDINSVLYCLATTIP